MANILGPDDPRYNDPRTEEIDPATGLPKPPAPAAAAPGYGGPLPPGYSQGEVNDWLSRNPGDTGRVMSALNDRGPKAPQYQTPTQQWNAQPSALQGNSSQLYQQLMQRAQQGTAVSSSDPNIRAQVDPVVAQQTRASRSYLDQLAEKSGPLANLQGERRLASERSGQAAGALESEVIGREIGARRDEIQQALSQWGQMLTADQRNALEMELAQLNDRARTADRTQNQSQFTASQAQGNDQFLRELALREWIAGDQSSRGWAGL